MRRSVARFATIFCGSAAVVMIATVAIWQGWLRGPQLPARLPPGAAAIQEGQPERAAAKAAHPLLGAADGLLVTEGWEEGRSTASPALGGIARQVLQAAAEPETANRLVVDYPQDGAVFPPEIVPPTFLWHDSDETVDTWLIDISVKDQPGRTAVLSAGPSPPQGSIDPACIAPTNEIYKPTAYQASARSWTPASSLWAAIKRRSVDRRATVTILGFASNEPRRIVSRGRVSIVTSSDPVGAPIFYRDVPLAPAVTERGVIKPLSDDAIHLIGWRLRDIARPESRLLLSDVPTCTNCHSFSADGRTLGMDLDGPQGDKGAYALASIARRTVIEDKNVISWNSFQDKPQGHKTVGFLSRISPDGQYVATTLNESVYVSNFADYRFLQVFYPTRGILGYHRRSTGAIKALPGADDPKYVHCDPVWTPDGKEIVFARAEAKDAYPKDGKLAQRANDPLETPIQYDLYRMPFADGRGGRPQPIRGASHNGMSNNFPKVSPDGKWIVFVKCRNGQLMRPDSTLWIVPAEGGDARRMECNTPLMNSWHSFSPNGRWMVFSSKANTPYTQMFLTHLDAGGNSSPAVLIPDSTAANRAVNLPEFINRPYDDLLSIAVPGLDYLRHALQAAQLAKAGKLDEAVAQYDRAVELKPDFLPGRVEAAISLARQGKSHEAKARLEAVLGLDPNYGRAHAALGAVLADLGQKDESMARYRKAVAISPSDRLAHAGLANLLLEQAKAEEAIVHFQAAVRLDPDDPQIRLQLGNAFLRQQRFEEAAAQFERCLEINPRLVDAHLRLGKLLSMQGRFTLAAGHLEKAVAAEPQNLRAAADLAWLLAVCPQGDLRNGPRAVELARQACEATRFVNPILLDTLAAAYAETGDYPQAIAMADRALSLLPPRDKALVPSIRQHLQSYREGKAWRPK